jgi:hypothetical protein
MRSSLLILSGLALSAFVPAAPAQWVNLLNGRDLGGWEVVGDGLWKVMRDGTLLGQRDLHHADNQSWVYTKKDYGEYDLHVEWWTRFGGNSGVSIRDTSRAKYAVGKNWDPNRTPSHIGYEIQISNGDKDEYGSGSVYLFAKAKTGFQFDDDWNALDIQSRTNVIRVKLNDHPVAEYAGAPGRPTVGPIGLQLHDPTAVAMFRNIRIRELPKK